MTQEERPDAELTRRVAGLTALLAGALAAACGLLWDLREALGVLAGSAVTLANFTGLHWVAGRALRPAEAALAPPAGRGYWLCAGMGRLGLLALVLGVVVAQGWVGWGGLLMSLVIVPVTVVIAGLRVARAA